MSLVNLAHICSHLQNASRARLSLTSIPMTKLHLRLVLSMQKQGLISTVQVAGHKPPVPETERPISEAWRQELELELQEEPWLGLGYDEKIVEGKESKVTEAVPANPAERRIWLGLKYWNNEPVLSSLSLISTPKRRVTAKWQDLTNLVRGRRAGIVKGLVSPGECLFISSDIGVLEAREAVERKKGGLYLCRAS